MSSAAASSLRSHITSVNNYSLTGARSQRTRFWMIPKRGASRRSRRDQNQVQDHVSLSCSVSVLPPPCFTVAMMSFKQISFKRNTSGENIQIRPESRFHRARALHLLINNFLKFFFLSLFHCSSRESQSCYL